MTEPTIHPPSTCISAALPLSYLHRPPPGSPYRPRSLHEGDAEGERSAELGLPAHDRGHPDADRGLLDLDRLLGEMKLERLEELAKERLHLDHAAKEITRQYVLQVISVGDSDGGA